MREYGNEPMTVSGALVIAVIAAASCLLAAIVAAVQQTGVTQHVPEFVPNAITDGINTFGEQISDRTSSDLVRRGTRCPCSTNGMPEHAHHAYRRYGVPARPRPQLHVVDDGGAQPRSQPGLARSRGHNLRPVGNRMKRRGDKDRIVCATGTHSGPSPFIKNNPGAYSLIIC